MTPLSHHDILRYVGPFSRASRQVDLEASDRAARTIAFRAVEHSVRLAEDDTVTVKERLVLNLSQPTPRLRRTLTAETGLEATLSARHDTIEVLLQRVLDVPVDDHFRRVSGALVAESFRCPEDAGKPPVLRESRAYVRSLELILDARTVSDEPLTGKLFRQQPEQVSLLPDDLVAVLGRPWTLLRERDAHLMFKLYAPRREPRRTTTVRERFARTIRLLDRVLSEGPDRFHARFRSQRWRVWLRRLTPIFVVVAMLGSLPLFKYYVLDKDVMVNPYALGLPNILFAIAFYLTRHEIPSFELPPFPKPLPSDAWLTEATTVSPDAGAATKEVTSHG